MQKPDIKYIASLLTSPDWNYDIDADVNEIPFTKKSLQRFNDFISKLTGMAADTIQYEDNGIGGIFAKYMSHYKHDGNNSIMKVCIDFGDDMFSYYYLKNNKFAEHASFMPYDKLETLVPLK